MPELLQSQAAESRVHQSGYGPEDWGRFLPEHTTAVSMLDRLLHHATTVITNGQSYRMRQARQRAGGDLLNQ